MNGIHIARRAAGSSNYYFADKLAEIRRLIAAGHDVINLGVGSPDLAPNPSVQAAISGDMSREGAFGYQPYRGVADLTRRFGEYLSDVFNVDLPPEGIVPLMGSKEGCGFLALAHLDAGDGALVPDPGYPTYSSATRLAGGEVLPYALREETGYLPVVSELERSRLDAESRSCTIRMMWLNYPHMPTGTPPDAVRLTEVVVWAREHGILLVHDNPYARILNSAPPFSIMSIEGSSEVCIELHSMSKSHRLAGARMGFAVGQPALLAPMFKVATQFASGSWRPLQHAAIAALDADEDGIAEANGIYAARKVAALELMSTLGCRVDGHQVGMFVWAKAPEGWDGNRLSDALLDQCRVFITPGSVFGSQGQGHIRLSLCSPVERIQAAHERIKTSFAPHHED